MLAFIEDPQKKIPEYLKLKGLSNGSGAVLNIKEVTGHRGFDSNSLFLNFNFNERNVEIKNILTKGDSHYSLPSKVELAGFDEPVLGRRMGMDNILIYITQNVIYLRFFPKIGSNVSILEQLSPK
ncbi:MAG: hypothetical protein ABSE68_01180 [Minisyncoccia bacterium]